ncbi:MAG: ABC transporter ATP-binding protein/permease [Actinomycetota bacterium]|nr:ABC transporter ATP-binding protein/permease [Actinomycetota bacterium]
MAQATPTAAERSGAVRQGVGLLTRTALHYRGDSWRSIAGAAVWMVAVVVSPYLIKLIVDGAIQDGDTGLLVPLVVILVATGVVQAVGIGVRRFYGFRLSYRAEADLRNRMFIHLQRLGFRFHDETSTGQLMARASSDLSQVRLIFAMLPITLANLAMFVAVAVVLIVIDPVLGAVSALIVPVLLALSGWYARRVIGLSFEVQERLAELSQVVQETVAGIQVVKAYGQEAAEQARLDATADRIYNRTLELTRQAAAFSPLFELIPSLGTVAVLWLGGFRVVDGAITIGDFVAYTQYLIILVLPIRITGWFFATLPRAAAAATRVESLLATEAAPAEPADPQPLPDGPGEVVFDGVRFGYGGYPVLDGVDLRIPGGTSVALVGSTGSGKTTMAHLIPRFHDVDAGAVRIDGVDVGAIALDDLRGEVAVVFQETFLFSSSVRDNIALGAPDATDEQIRAAARLARAHEFICRLPLGYDTVVGERGHSLSGGQRQRVALARAVLRDPRVLILDDATSSVDAVVEAEIQQALRQVTAGRTTVIVAHRTSTLALVDQVVFLEDGRIAAVGPHRTLLATAPRYAAVLASAGGPGPEAVLP